jgi:transcriptional regulator with PAS, ATPase and Fis domain
MRGVERTIQTIADKDVIVTLIGESGTGKDVLARRVHELSARRAGPFVAINCAAIPEALFESELFGHERGAFTGAHQQTSGKIEAAIGGTLFLDEIGEMPLGVQAKLLRFLENRRFMRVGGVKKIAVDIRLVTASLRSLEQDVKSGRFRADLFYRIEGITIPVPPLRARGADIDPLVRVFLAEFSTTHGTKPPRLTRAAMAALRSYAWPGNVRELRNVVERVCLMRAGRSTDLGDLPEKIQQASAFPEAAIPGEAMGEELTVRLDAPLRASIDRIVDAALVREDGNQSAVARRLKIGLRTVQRYVARAHPRVAARPSRSLRRSRAGDSTAR